MHCASMKFKKFFFFFYHGATAPVRPLVRVDKFLTKSRGMNFLSVFTTLFARFGWNSARQICVYVLLLAKAKDALVNYVNYVTEYNICSLEYCALLRCYVVCIGNSLPNFRNKFWHSEDRASWYMLVIKSTSFNISQIYFCKELYMFRTDLLSIIKTLDTAYTTTGICHYLCWLYASEVMMDEFHPDLASRQLASLAWQIPITVNTILTFWRWNYFFNFSTLCI